MTLRLTFGIDPGLTGAVATLIDGEPGPMLDMPTTRVDGKPEVWKRHFRIPGKSKDPDAGRCVAIARFPSVADQLQRKKDSGRADALWLALWLEQQQMGAEAA